MSSPNVEPIFIKTPRIETLFIENSVVPRRPTVESPILLFTAGTNGSLIDAIQINQLTAQGSLAYPEFRFYRKGGGTEPFTMLFSERIQFETNEAVIPTEKFVTLPPSLIHPPLSVNNIETYPKCLRLPPEYELYVGLSATISGGAVVAVYGGDY